MDGKSNGGQGRPIIYEFERANVFLKSLFIYLKKNNPIYSYRFVARKCGYKSPTFLKLIVEGQRNTSTKQLKKLREVLKMSRSEFDFLQLLARRDATKDSDERDGLTRKIDRIKAYYFSPKLNHDQLRYFLHWYYVAISEMAGLSDFKQSPEWISEKLLPVITSSEAKEALETLERLNVLSKDSSGKLSRSGDIFTTGPEVSHWGVVNFLREMSVRGMDAITNIPHAEREIGGVTLCLDENEFKWLKSCLIDLRKKALTTAVGRTSPTARVYQLNLQLFPLTKAP